METYKYLEKIGLGAYLGAFAKFRKATINFVMSVRLSAWNNSASTGRTDFHES